MGFIGVFLIYLGSLCVASATECVPETAKCSKYWVKMLPHKNLIATEDELDSWCSKQNSFYKCLEDVFYEGKDRNMAYLPTNLLISKLFSHDLCSKDSKNRERLLSNAECINQLDTDFCILPEYLEIVTPDDSIPSTRCSQAEKTFSCIAATMVLNCGFDAGRVYRAMLKITRYSDEVCGIEVSDGIPPCEGSYKKSVDREKKLSEIYYGLYDRIGSLLDEQNDLVDSETESFPQSEDEAITEAIRSAIDNLDENIVSEELHIPENDSDDISSCREDIKEYKEYMKNPHITEVFKELLFYNYSGKEYVAYWRQPEFMVFDKEVCTHLLPSYYNSTVFQCRTDYRYRDPDCLSNSTVHEKITPEFIRSFDPEVPCDSSVEFGPRPEWMKEIDEWYEERRIRNQMTTTSPLTTQIPDAVTSSSALLHLVSTAHSNEYYYQNWETEWRNYDFRAHGFNSLLPNEIHLELLDLLKPYLMETFVLPKHSRFRVGSSMFLIIYDSNVTEIIQNLTCSRIDECHPSGKGVWKCRMFPREIETCDTCSDKEPKYKPINFEFIRYPRPAPPSEERLRNERLEKLRKYARPATPSKLNVDDPTEPSVTVESSVFESSQRPTESIPSVSSGDTEPEKKLTVDQADELSFMKDEAYTEEELEDLDRVQYSLASDSDMDNGVRYQILESIFDKAEDVDSSRVIYAIESSDVDDDETEIIISTDRLLDGNIVLVSNIPDLDETKYTVVSAPPGFLE